MKKSLVDDTKYHITYTRKIITRQLINSSMHFARFELRWSPLVNYLIGTCEKMLTYWELNKWLCTCKKNQ